MKKKKKINRLCKNRDELFEKLKPSIKYLAYKFKIGGYIQEDLKQIMYLEILNSYNEHADKGLDWWFLRLKWSLLNLSKKEYIRNPLSNVLSIDLIRDGCSRKRDRFDT